MYSRSGSGWSFEAYIKAPNNAADDYFGGAVAVNNAANNGDTLVVGARGEGSC